MLLAQPRQALHIRLGQILELQAIEVVVVHPDGRENIDRKLVAPLHQSLVGIFTALQHSAKPFNMAHLPH